MKKTLLGYTLLELMVVVAIAALMAAIVLPNYDQHIKRARRTEAKQALASIATKLEKYFLNNNQYTTDISQLPGHKLQVSGGEYFTENRHYKITVVNAGSNWRVEAEIDGGGNQNNDTACRIFTLYLDGRRSAEDDGGNDSTSKCW